MNWELIKTWTPVVCLLVHLAIFIAYLIVKFETSLVMVSQEKCIREDQLGLLIKYLSLTITAFNKCIE
jgi:hypothetical protein